MRGLTQAGTFAAGKRARATRVLTGSVWVLADVGWLLPTVRPSVLSVAKVFDAVSHTIQSQADESQ
jgi:hypothetical protein